jgi:hypothetical protein
MLMQKNLGHGVKKSEVLQTKTDPISNELQAI